LSLNEVLQEAKDTIRKQQEQLEDLTTPHSAMLGIVKAVYHDSLIVATGSHLLQIMEASTKAYQPGDTISLHPETMNIIGKSDYNQYGQSGSVLNITTEFIEISVDGNSAFIQESKVRKLQKGDRVLLDATNSVIVKKLESEAERFLFSQKVDVTWNDIGGLSEAKKELQNAIEKPMQHQHIFQAFKKKTPKGFLFHGRPGNGKTLLGKAVSSSIAASHGKEAASSAFVYVKGPEILDKYVGETERTIRSLFEQCRQHKKKHGYEAVLFIDEADAILSNRTANHHTGIGQTVVPQFLSEMDGMMENSAIILLATNRADTLDPAVIRPGRIDRKLYIPPPSKEDAKEILSIHLRQVPIEGQDLEEQVTEELFSDKYPIYQLFKQMGEIVLFGLKDLISGAMLAGIVEQATMNAINRNIDGKLKSINGVAFADFEAALCTMRRSQFGLNHDLEVKEFAEARNFKPTQIKSVVQPGV
jgi:proteasome-associated ATPase